MSLAPLKKAINRRWVLDKWRALWRSFGCMGLHTNSSMAAMGYQVDNRCRLREAEEDTIFHRLYVCRHKDVSWFRDKYLSKARKERIKEAGPESALYARGWIDPVEWH